jgi:hypothetical protein
LNYFAAVKSARSISDVLNPLGENQFTIFFAFSTNQITIAHITFWNHNNWQIPACKKPFLKGEK